VLSIDVSRVANIDVEWMYRWVSLLFNKLYRMVDMAIILVIITKTLLMRCLLFGGVRRSNYVTCCRRSSLRKYILELFRFTSKRVSYWHIPFRNPKPNV